jgi:hypothetical protein
MPGKAHPRIALFVHRTTYHYTQAPGSRLQAPGCERLTSLCLILAAGLVSGCASNDTQPTETFYDRRIAPILTSSCASSPSGSQCHVTQDAYGNALGNLSFDSFDTLDKRRDLFVTYGPFPTPTLLLKALAPFQLSLSTWRGGDPIIITTDIPHAGGRLLDVTSSSYAQLSRWIARGGTENNALADTRQLDLTPCSDQLGSDPSFDPGVAPETSDYATFSDSVNPLLGQRCGAGNCHGSAANSLYLTCGDSEEQRRWNYFAAGDYVSVDATTSEIVRRALDPAEGGTFHGGGTVFESTDDDGYRALLDWAIEKGGPSRVPEDEGFELFADRVQPMLVKKGCTQLGCHSPAMGHDYRLRGGSAGHFGLPATRYNYELSLEQISLESSDPNASRMLRKNLPPLLGEGIRHRGGALMSGAGDPAACDLDAAVNGPLDEQDPYCVIVAWIARERAARLPADPGLQAIVYVQRPAGSGPESPQDFERYSPGADIIRAPASMGNDGWPTLSASGQSLLGVCGLSANATDVRRPSVSWDGTRVAFSARSAADQPWRVYVVVGTSCDVEGAIDAAPVDERGTALPDNGELVHNFDPAFSPDGRIVFSSTRGNVTNAEAFDYSGPQRTPADPSRLNANLYVAEDGAIRQLTFLLDQELYPSFMVDGRLIYTVEKRAPGFYQLAGRRQNLDGGDYHPLFGQRASIGYTQFSEAVELSDKNLAAILSDKGSQHGAGTLAVVNRSVGIDLNSDDPGAYPLDPDAPNRINESFYQHSLTIVDPLASGRLDATRGAYLSPSALPNGKVLVSYAPGATSLAALDARFGLHVLDPVSRDSRELLADDGSDLVWAVGVYARAPRRVFRSRLDEPNGSSHVFSDPGRRAISDVTYLDLPLLSSLLFQNTRSGRPVATTGNVEFWEQLPPASGVTSFQSGGSFVTSDEFGDLYVRRRRLGSIQPDPRDGSARVQLPGGVPFNLALEVDLDGDSAFRHQREAMQFYPGEFARQSFPRTLFDGVCGNCHGSVSGLESDVATNPDILTRASQVAARSADAAEMMSRGNVEGPEFP